ncbi:hypothetical protein BSL78_07003 [Apostichopus japonicus]|uniref:Ig-like domain-containing protein n=1 Tax=Stichopus japonicus TaxID=307972 RepID=A0A2G8L757_STIJA|nr:hypothetical protein BSL78_07003 [Apostichopus japonicus]
MAYRKTLSLRPNFSYMSVFRILIISTFFKIVFPQMVSFHIRDEINNSIVFESEENIALSCERSGFSEAAVVRIYKDETMLISEGLMSESDDYTVEAEGNATILTIKVASASTSGLYTCVVMDNSPAVLINSSLNFMVVEMNPQCYSRNIRTANVVVEGGTFQADCFYQDAGTRTEAIWLKRERMVPKRRYLLTKSVWELKEEEV